MGIKKFKPTSPGVRSMTVLTNEDLTQKKPERSLVEKRENRAGRNNQGRITSWHRGGAHKRKYRVIDFRRNRMAVPAKVAAIESAPNRSARIALLHYADGEKRYILSPVGLSVGDTVVSGNDADIKPGNALPIRQIPVGTMVHNVELKVGKEGQLARAAGNVVQILAKEGQYAHLRLGSGEVRLVFIDCMATVGQVGNLDHEKGSLGKGGRGRWPRPGGAARGGGAEPGGPPCTPWGKPTKGHKPRKNKASDPYIVKRRK